VNLSLALQESPGITAVAHAIQLAVAPVFLLSGIGAMLAVLTSRLSRIIDRGRALEAQLAAHPGDAATRIQAGPVLRRRHGCVLRGLVVLPP